MDNQIPDIFISYSSKKHDWVSHLASALKSANYRVWWDDELIAGQNFYESIPEALDKARCVLVVWCEDSVKSKWVQGEASLGDERNVLVPIICETANVPIAFRSLHNLDFRSWQRNPKDECFLKLLKAIDFKTDSPQKTDQNSSNLSNSKSIVKKSHLSKGCSISIAFTLCLLLLPTVLVIINPSQQSIGPSPSLAIIQNDDVKAENVEQYRSAAIRGNAEAQTYLGMLYQRGKGVKWSDTEALKWYYKAAEQGNALAQTHLGLMHQHGEGVKQSDTQAVEWYHKAAESGNAIAQTYLGMFYQQGRGVKQSNTQALKWYRKAAETGNALAQTKLGSMYQLGLGVEQSDTQAVEWYRKAAERGNTEAQRQLQQYDGVD